jgi:hypothetical protein
MSYTRKYLSIESDLVSMLCLSRRPERWRAELSAFPPLPECHTDHQRRVLNGLLRQFRSGITITPKHSNRVGSRDPMDASIPLLIRGWLVYVGLRDSESLLTERVPYPMLQNPTSFRDACLVMVASFREIGPHV